MKLTRRMRSVAQLGMLTSAALVLSLLSPTAATAAPGVAPTGGQGPVVTGRSAVPIARQARPASSTTKPIAATKLAHTVSASLATASSAAAAGAARVDVAGGTTAVVSGDWQHLGSSGVSVAPLAGAGASAAAVSGVDAAVLSRAEAKKLGLGGLVLRLTRTDGGSAAGPLGVEIPDSVLDGVYGAGYASRVRWAQVTAPAGGTKQKTALAAAVPVAATPVTTEQVRRPAATTTGASGATVLPASDIVGTRLAVTRAASVSAADAVVVSPVLGAKTVLLAAVATPTSATGAGTFTATPLNSAQLWDVSASTGGFSWTMPMAVPPAAAGPSPDLGLAYDSQAVDGETGSTNNQPSAVGDGWSLKSGGSITRSYEPCSLITGLSGAVQAAAKVSGDQCWAGDNATLTLGGHSGLLIRDAGTGQWRLQNDDGTRIQHVVGTTPATGDVTGCADNGTYDTDCWVATTTDGTQYYFGLNKLPGYAAGNPTTNSAWTVPVFATAPGQPCYDASGFAASSCMQGWQWNLDYVVDVHGNAESYYYDAQSNMYSRNGTTAVSYTRGGVLDHIDYGFAAGDAYKQNAPSDRVVFGYDASGRCVTGCSNQPLSGAAPTPATPANYPDVPYDLNCGSGPCTDQVAPSFYSTSMLDTVTTQALVGGGYQKVDVWTLGHSFPDPGDTADGTTAALWLTQVAHTGYSGSASLAEPTTVFKGEPLQNRVWTNGYAPLMKYRVSSILTALGAVVSVNYSTGCSVADAQAVLADPSTNHHPCFPEWWSPPEPAGVPAPGVVQDVFNKYTVTSVVQNPETGGGNDATRETDYVYTGTPAWRKDIAPQTPAQYKTYSDFAGFSSVEVREGSPGASSPQTATDYTFYQGLGATLTASSSISTAMGYTPQIVDNLAFAGQAFETRVLNGVGGAVVSDTMSLLAVSAITSQDSAGQHANIVRTTRTVLAQPVAAGGWRFDETDTTYGTAYALPMTVSTYVSDGLGVYGVPNAFGSTVGGNTCTTNTYATANTTAWIIGSLAESSKIGLDCATVSSMTLAAVPVASVISDVRTYYDGGALGAMPTHDDVTQTDQVDSFSGTTFSTGNWKTFSKASYDADGRPLSATDVLGNTTSTAYTPAAGAAVGSGALTAETVTNPMGWKTTTAIDPQRGAETKVTDVNGKVTTAAYDALGRRTGVWLANNPQDAAPQNPSIGYAYTLSQTSPNVIATTTLGQTGASTVYALYDGLGQQVQTQSPTAGPSGGAIVTDTAYNTAGQTAFTNNAYWEQTVAPSGALFNPGNEQEIPSQQVSAYDGAGRVTTSTLVSNAKTRFTTTTAYLGADRVDVTPPSGGTPSTTYTNSLGEQYQLIQYTGGAIGAGTALKTKYTFIPSHDMGSMTDPAGNTWTWTYDILRHKVKSVDPDTGTTTTGYDDAGNTLTSTDGRGVQLSYTYDALNRQTAAYQGAAGTGSLLTSTVYDTLAKGQTTSTTSYTGSTPGTPGLAYKQTVSGYTDLYQSTGSTTSIPSGAPAFGGTSYTVADTWNADQTLGSQADPAAGGLPAETIKYEYDPQQLLNTVVGATMYVTNVGYSGTNQVAETDSDPNGGTNGSTGTNGTNGSATGMYRTYGYDPATGALLQDQDQSATATGTYANLANRTYTRNDAGEVTSLTTTAAGVATDTQCFAYDGISDLTSAWTPSSNSCAAAPSATALGGPAPYLNTYAVNTANGNRTSSTQTTGGTVETDTYAYPASGAANPHAVQSVTKTGAATATYGYDAAGDTTTRPGQTLTYDAFGRVATTVVGGTTQTDVYDASGTLLLQSDPKGGATLFVGDTQLHQAPSGGAVTGSRTYTGPSGTPVAERDTTAGGPSGGAVFWLGADANGTTDVEVNASTGAVTRRYADPYGNVRGAAATWSSPRGYLNAPVSGTTGLTQLGARVYDSVLGRFLSVDPVLVPGNPEQDNGYAYSGNDPVTLSDPSGACYQGSSDALDFHSNCSAGAGKPVTHGINQQGTDHGSPVNYSGKSIADTVFEIEYVDDAVDQAVASIDWKGISSAGAKAAAVALQNAEARFIASVEGMAEQDSLDAQVAMFQMNSAGAAAPEADGEIMGMSEEGSLLASENAAVDEAQVVQEPDAVSSGVGCGGESFTPETGVVLASGMVVPLQSIKPGDRVRATDPKTGKTTVEPVEKVWVNHDTDLMDVTVESGGHTSVIHSTQHHLFWDVTKHAWVEAEDLPAGDALLAQGYGSTVVVSGVKVVEGSADMWDLTVGTDHDFYVAATADTTVLVHNCPSGIQGQDALTTGQAKQMAARVGYTKQVKERVGGQAVFTNGKTYIVQDTTDHTGGLWKMARTISALESKTTRMGTYDFDLNYVAP